jgi:trans-aconitate 2-methyltransferase
MPWDPDRYHQFQTQRSAPFDDLLGLVKIRPHLKVVDLGCGTGELTRRLADALPESDVLGLDLSTEMLDRAAQYARAGLRFEHGDQANLSGSFDLIFSNAALQWSEDHPALLSHLYGCLAQGGQLAVQVPSNHTHISHLIIREVAGREPFRGALKGFMRQAPVLAIEEYAQILFDLNGRDIIVFEKVYPHVLENSDAVVDWISGTALVPYFERLDEVTRAQFTEAIRARMKAELPAQPIFYPFKRTLFSAVKP